MVPVLIGVHMFNSMFSSDYFVWEYFSIRDCFVCSPFFLDAYENFQFGLEKKKPAYLKCSTICEKYRNSKLWLSTRIS